jgi:hypothetical protein
MADELSCWRRVGNPETLCEIERRLQMRSLVSKSVSCLGVTVALMVASEASGQAPVRIDCQYQECALRIQVGAFGQDLVKGAGEAKVNGLGLFATDLSAVFAGSPAAQELAAMYRRRHNAGSAMALVGAGLFIAALFTVYDADTTAGWLAIGGSFVVATGAVVDASSRDRLNRAIWEYNGALSR